MIFADTFYLLALFNSGDDAHGAAVAFAQRFSGRLLTTAWVLTEVADALANQANRKAAIDFLDDLRVAPNLRILRPSAVLFRNGYELYRSRTDKEWSLTDCISFVVMADHGVTEALTGDRHFEQAGFKALLK